MIEKKTSTYNFPRRKWSAQRQESITGRVFSADGRDQSLYIENLPVTEKSKVQIAQKPPLPLYICRRWRLAKYILHNPGIQFDMKTLWFGGPETDRQTDHCTMRLSFSKIGNRDSGYLYVFIQHLRNDWTLWGKNWQWCLSTQCKLYMFRILSLIRTLTFRMYALTRQKTKDTHQALTVIKLLRTDVLGDQVCP